MFEKIYKSGKTIQVLANHDQKGRREITYATKKNKSSEHGSEFTKYPKIDKTKSTLNYNNLLIIQGSGSQMPLGHLLMYHLRKF